jgi:hypothetical protein
MLVNNSAVLNQPITKRHLLIRLKSWPLLGYDRVNSGLFWGIVCVRVRVRVRACVRACVCVYIYVANV